MINVFIAEDNKDVRLSLIDILKADPDIQVVGETDNGDDAVEQAKSLLPDLILMDIKLLGMDGLESAKRIKEFCGAEGKDIKIVILSTFYDDDFVQKSLDYGVDGYLLKGMASNRLASVVKNICNGLVTFDRVVFEKKDAIKAKHADAKPELGLLSKTELGILRLIANGKTNAEIATELFFTEGTVRNYISIMLSKLGCRNARDLAVYGIKAGL